MLQRGADGAATARMRVDGRGRPDGDSSPDQTSIGDSHRRRTNVAAEPSAAVSSVTSSNGTLASSRQRNGCAPSSDSLSSCHSSVASGYGSMNGSYCSSSATHSDGTSRPRHAQDSASAAATGAAAPPVMLSRDHAASRHGDDHVGARAGALPPAASTVHVEHGSKQGDIGTITAQVASNSIGEAGQTAADQVHLPAVLPCVSCSITSNLSHGQRLSLLLLAVRWLCLWACVHA